MQKNKNGLYDKQSEYMLKQYGKHEYPRNPDLKLKSIINGIYQDYSSEITKELLKRMKVNYWFIIYYFKYFYLSKQNIYKCSRFMN